MGKRRLELIPYPAIERHGLVGDRRTAALVANDGTIDWMCLPDFDGTPYFGALLDAGHGGFFRLGPAIPTSGKQRYRGETAVLETIWSEREYELELSDVFAWPEDDRDERHADRRALVRRLRCNRGRARCSLVCAPRIDLERQPTGDLARGGVTFLPGSLRLATSAPLRVESEATRADFELAAGEEVWAVLEHGEEPFLEWTSETVADTAASAAAWWASAHALGQIEADRADRLRGAARAVELLVYQPAGSIVAAPTCSLPERIGGERNYDYRYTWVRDASLAATAFTLLGVRERAGRFLDWLAHLGSATDAPLQVVYGPRGTTRLPQHARKNLEGYRESRPVLFGNHAVNQTQHGSLGYVADCAHMFLREGGEWKPEYTKLVARLADHIDRVWDTPDSGIWELTARRDFVASRVMCWVVLDRAIQIADAVGQCRAADVARWRTTRQRIHDEVMARGWSERLGAFRQHYDADTVDASTLLVAVMGFLPADHPRVAGTVQRLVETLSIDGLLYRFVPNETPEESPLPIGEFEGAFIPCTCWLATTYAHAGRHDEAEDVLGKIERCGFDLHLYPEEIDARSNTGLGNFPLLFSQAEYIRAVIALERSRRR